MRLRTAAGILLALASLLPLAADKEGRKDLPRIEDPSKLSVEMAKALVAGDRGRFETLFATKEEMEETLMTAWKPSTEEEREEIRCKVADLVSERAEAFDRFQAMKKEAGVKEGRPLRFEPLPMDPPREKDGMKIVRHAKVRMVQTGEDGKEEAFLIGLDDMLLLPRGWAFSSPDCGIGKEPPK